MGRGAHCYLWLGIVEGGIMIDFIQHHSGIVANVFALVVVASFFLMYFDRKRREAQNLPISRTKKAWVFILGAQLIIFGGFVIGVLASSH